jgi:predicted component of type VI protein secretion system
LAPAQIQALLAKGGGTGLLPSGRKARLWERYEQLHEQLASEELAAGAAGREFVEAYSNQYHKI